MVSKYKGYQFPLHGNKVMIVMMMVLLNKPKH